MDNIGWEASCSFAPRCSQEIGLLPEGHPPLAAAPQADPSHRLRCHNPVLGEVEVGVRSSGAGIGDSELL